MKLIFMIKDKGPPGEHLHCAIFVWKEKSDYPLSQFVHAIKSHKNQNSFSKAMSEPLMLVAD